VGDALTSALVVTAALRLRGASVSARLRRSPDTGRVGKPR